MARTPQTFDLLPSETVMPDDASMFDMYVYIIDGKFTRYAQTMFPETVGEAKRRHGIKEVRRCELFARKDACLGDMVRLPEGAAQ